MMKLIMLLMIAMISNENYEFLHDNIDDEENVHNYNA